MGHKFLSLLSTRHLLKSLLSLSSLPALFCWASWNPPLFMHHLGISQGCERSVHSKFKALWLPSSWDVPLRFQLLRQPRTPALLLSLVKTDTFCFVFYGPHEEQSLKCGSQAMGFFFRYLGPLLFLPVFGHFPAHFKSVYNYQQEGQSDTRCFASSGSQMFKCYLK